MDFNLPQVSIIMPCYNAGLFINQAIDSVLSQTFQNWELLVIDDCSSDGSDKLIKTYCESDDRIKYFKTKKNSGSPMLPRNIGVENAKGQYLAFLDSDDIWLSTKLESQMRLMQQKDAAFVFSDYERISENGERTGRIVNAPESVSYRQLLKGNVIGCLTAMYNTEKVGKILFESIGHEDYVVWLSILKHGFRAYNTMSVEALYRERKNSVSSNKIDAAKWQWNIYIEKEKTGYFKAMYYFVNYAIKAFNKRLK